MRPRPRPQDDLVSLIVNLVYKVPMISAAGMIIDAGSASPETEVQGAFFPLLNWKKKQKSLWAVMGDETISAPPELSVADACDMRWMFDYRTLCGRIFFRVPPFTVGSIESSIAAQYLTASDIGIGRAKPPQLPHIITMASDEVKSPDLGIRLEDISMKHVYDFHKMWSSERVALYSKRVVDKNIDASRVAFKRLLADTMTKKPWIMKKAIMVAKPGSEHVEEAAGFISTVRPSPYGLLLAYQLRHDCWNKGYATAATRMFLEEYWGEPRIAPLGEVYLQPHPQSQSQQQQHRLSEVDSGNGELENDEDEDEESEESEEMVEIYHLIAEVDLDNKGSMRVTEKCGGRIIGTVDLKLQRFNDLRTHAVWRLDKPEPELEPSLSLNEAHSPDLSTSFQSVRRLQIFGLIQHLAYNLSCSPARPLFAMALAGLIDPTKMGNYPVILGDGLLGKTSNEIFTGIRYNHKPALSSSSAPNQARLKPSIPGKTNSYDLSYNDGDNKYAFAGTRSIDDNQYVLYFDPDRKAFVLDKVDSTFNMNVTRLPNDTDPSSLRRKYSPIDTTPKATSFTAGESAAAAKDSSSNNTKAAPKPRAKPPAPKKEIKRKPEKKQPAKNISLSLPMPMPASEPAKPEPKRRAPPPQDDDDEDDDDDDDDGGLLIEYPDGAPPQGDDADGEDDDEPDLDFKLPSPVNNRHPDQQQQQQQQQQYQAMDPEPMDEDDEDDDGGADLEGDLEKELEIAFDLENSQEGGSPDGDESEISEED
ncbi:hypothetical protein G7046_g7525 [Stylonectria norvegica]|nr:hypothetical protein G7046_g7525 [Stylonectria norvegica]